MVTFLNKKWYLYLDITVRDNRGLIMCVNVVGLNYWWWYDCLIKHLNKCELQICID